MSKTQEQKVFKRSARKRRLSGSDGSWKFYLLRVFSVPTRWLIRGFSFVFSHPRIAMFGAVPVAVALLLFLVSHFLQRYHDRILPSAVAVNAADSRLAARIQSVSENAIKEARLSHQSRTQFLHSLSRALEDVEGIDEFWMRLGFDRKLQITATQEVPVLLLETGSGDRYLIGHKLKVIAKNPQTFAQRQILRVTVPELKMRDSKQTVRWTRQNRFTRTSDAVRLTAENVNLPWLFRQAQVLQTSLGKTYLRLGIERVTWKAHTGFSLVVSGNVFAQENQASAVNDNVHLQVLLGEGELSKKIDKLTEVISDLRSRKMGADVIDLNYADKAIIKTSEKISNKPI